MNEFNIGDPVCKVKGYMFPGEVRAVVKTIAGETRYVVECTAKGCEGMLHIFNAGQLERRRNDDVVSK